MSELKPSESIRTLETILQILARHNKADLTCFYPEGNVETLKFLKENINRQIENLINKEKLKDI